MCHIYSGCFFWRIFRVNHFPPTFFQLQSILPNQPSHNCNSSIQFYNDGFFCRDFIIWDWQVKFLLSFLLIFWYRVCNCIWSNIFYLGIFITHNILLDFFLFSVIIWWGLIIKSEMTSFFYWSWSSFNPLWYWFFYVFFMIFNLSWNFLN